MINPETFLIADSTEDMLAFACDDARDPRRRTGVKAMIINRGAQP